MRRLIDSVAEDPSLPWSDSTRNTFISDANAIFEALLLEYGVEAALEAVKKHGYSATGEYRYAAARLFDKALKRRADRDARRSRKGQPDKSP